MKVGDLVRCHPHSHYGRPGAWLVPKLGVFLGRVDSIHAHVFIDGKKLCFLIRELESAI